MLQADEGTWPLNVGSGWRWPLHCDRRASLLAVSLAAEVVMCCVCVCEVWAAGAEWGQQLYLDVGGTKSRGCNDGAPEHGTRDVDWLPDPVGVARRAGMLQQVGGLSGNIADLALHSTKLMMALQSWSHGERAASATITHQARHDGHSLWIYGVVRLAHQQDGQARAAAALC